MTIRFFLKSGQSFDVKNVDRIKTKYSNETGALTTYEISWDDANKVKGKPVFVKCDAIEAIIRI